MSKNLFLDSNGSLTIFQINSQSIRESPSYHKKVAPAVSDKSFT